MRVWGPEANSSVEPHSLDVSTPCREVIRKVMQGKVIKSSGNSPPPEVNSLVDPPTPDVRRGKGTPCRVEGWGLRVEG